MVCCECLLSIVFNMEWKSLSHRILSNGTHKLSKWPLFNARKSIGSATFIAFHRSCCCLRPNYSGAEKKSTKNTLPCVFVSNGRAYILSTPNNNDDDDDDETNGMHVSTVIKPIWTPFLYRFLAAAPFHINRHTAYRLLFVFQFRCVRVFCFLLLLLQFVCSDFEFCRKKSDQHYST